MRNFMKKKRLRKQGIVPQRREPAKPYKEIIRENEAFFKYYKAQHICENEAEWEQLLFTLRQNLPTTFRVAGCKDEANALLEIIKTQMFEAYVNGVAEINQIPKEEVRRPIRLPWYPGGLAWQLNLSRKDIRRSEPLFRLHNFLIVETNAGSISRQEAVSMIPPLVLDVKPTDKVLDMCAAPGSKTAQLIEALHAENDSIPKGYVVANDVSNDRCYMLVHQAKRLNSPCIVVTNHDSSFFPDLLQTGPDGEKTVSKFDKILCDVPCSGDGTLRKNPDIWPKWNTAHANNLHGIQYRITRRGAELLEVGGRLVYSTCSLNPVENEAVLQRLIKESDGCLEIVDASHLVPELKYKPGMTKWIVASKDVDIYEKFDEVPEKYHTLVRPQMFPLPPGEIEKIGLDKCIRIHPHMQDTGGFFVAVIEKKKKLKFEIQSEAEVLTLGKHKLTGENEDDLSSEAKSSTAKRKKRRLTGFKEDPYVFFKDNEVVWNDLKSFYELTDAFDKRCLLTRCHADRKKNIYFCSESIRDLVQLNEAAIKVVNTGVKTFARCENLRGRSSYRLAQEGLFAANGFIGDSRRIQVTKDDLIMMLLSTDPSAKPLASNLDPVTQERVKELDVGSCVLKYVDERLTLFVVGWRGTNTLRAYVGENETIHLLRLLGADLSKFEKNKFKKTEAVEGGDAKDEKEETNVANETHGNTAALDESEDVPEVDHELAA